MCFARVFYLFVFLCSERVGWRVDNDYRRRNRSGNRNRRSGRVAVLSAEKTIIIALKTNNFPFFLFILKAKTDLQKNCKQMR